MFIWFASGLHLAYAKEVIGDGVSRIGEASNPGPTDTLWLGTTNPSGFRGKESLALDWGPGLWHLSETQLSASSFAASRASLRSQGQAQHRNIRVLAGAPAPLRSGSSWAGSWTGVLTFGDFPAKPLALTWTPGAFETGRVQATQHFVAGHQIITTNVYGYCQGPTYPDAKARTELLLADVTKEIVLGRRGFRAILGDLNHAADSLEQVKFWQAHGWADIQDLAWQWWGRVPVPTCKHATRRDYIFVSPELAAHLCEVCVREDFADHCTLIAGLKLELGSQRLLSWPLPSDIPWNHVDLDSWRAAPVLEPAVIVDSSSWLASFAEQFEQSLSGHLRDRPNGTLPPRCTGRAKRLQPKVNEVPAVPPRPHRPGEEPLHHGLLSLETKRWYQQLRRLQSLCHALKAGKQTPAACEYRLQLWRAIVEAKGFVGGFGVWWQTRNCRHPQAPAQLRGGLPCFALAQLLFEDFRDNYRRLEAWSIQQRCRVLQDKYAQQRDLVYRDLRDAASSQVDFLVLNHCYTVVAVDSDSRAIHVDCPLDTRGHSSWLLDDCPCLVKEINGHDCVVTAPSPPEVDSELKQALVLTDISHIHDEFVSLWHPRWNQLASFSREAWERLVSFAKAHLPPGNFELPPITVGQWRQMIARFKPRAAKGPDGFAKADLVHMKDGQVLQLLGFLQEIEAGARPWPKQWLMGVICRLLKPNNKTDANGYRPICVYSIVYRAWASIRAHQLLICLRPLLSSTTFGFVPGRSTTLMWWSMEALIEAACLSGSELMGFCTDVVKAFNCLPRGPLLDVAEWIGFPHAILHPWRSFLDGVERRFSVQGYLSEPQLSNRGFVEGCPLSPVAMVIADLLWHTYLEVFQPKVSAYSFVDNLSCLATDVASLAGGINCTRVFCDLLQLELDEEKTYVWSVSPESRVALSSLGIRAVTHARELGGIFAFGPAVRNAPLRTRCEALKPLFARLSKSRSPLPYKLAALPARFWASALHAISGCPVTDKQICQLRTAAAKALHVMPAGTSPLLRLSISSPMTADPGFFQLWQCIVDLRHVLHPRSEALDLWRDFMLQYTGRPLHGPFTKLLQAFAQIGWRLDFPPTVQDHDGLCWNLLDLPTHVVRRRAEQAWLRFVGHTHQHRVTMVDLRGIDLALLRASAAGLSALNLARTHALQAGAFVFDAAHAKFDLAKSGMCRLCGVEDTKFHRVCVCPRFQELRAPHVWATSRWPDLPVCLTHHLLAPCNPFVPEVLSGLLGLVDSTGSFFCAGNPLTTNHLFTDGSCFQHQHGDLNLAAWGVVNATTEEVVATGLVPGLTQTTQRAELSALLAALRWIAIKRVSSTIWSLLEGTALPPGLANRDLWQRIASAVCLCEGLRVNVQHVPSHLQDCRCESPFEDWIKRWNDHADRLAVMSNRNRSAEFLQRFRLAEQAFQDMVAVQRALQAVYLGIADLEPQHRASADLEDPPEGGREWILPLDSRTTEVGLAEALPLDGLAKTCSVL